MSLPFLIGLEGDPATWGVPPVGKVMIGFDAVGNLTIKQNDGTITPIRTGNPSVSNVVNSSGTTIVQPTAPGHIEIIDVQSSPRNVPITLSIAGAIEGWFIRMLVKFPAVAGYQLTIRNEDGSGDIVASFDNTSDPVIVSVKYEFVFLDGAWTLFSAQAPAY